MALGGIGAINSMTQHELDNQPDAHSFHRPEVQERWGKRGTFRSREDIRKDFQESLKKENPNTLRKPPISAKKLTVVIATAWIGWVIAYLILWETQPTWQVILNRISWCSSDIVGISATAIALYTYRNWEKSTENDDLRYMSSFIFELRKIGVRPEMVSELATVLSSGPDSPDKEFAQRFIRNMAVVLKDKSKNLHKLSDAEMQEFIRTMLVR